MLWMIHASPKLPRTLWPLLYMPFAVQSSENSMDNAHACGILYVDSSESGGLFVGVIGRAKNVEKNWWITICRFNPVALGRDCLANAESATIPCASHQLCSCGHVILFSAISAAPSAMLCAFGSYSPSRDVRPACLVSIRGCAVMAVDTHALSTARITIALLAEEITGSVEPSGLWLCSAVHTSDRCGTAGWSNAGKELLKQEACRMQCTVCTVCLVCMRCTVCMQCLVCMQCMVFRAEAKGAHPGLHAATMVGSLRLR